MVRVKICGLMEVEHARAAAKAGADFIGLVFAPSRRRITPDETREIVAAIKEYSPKPEVVGVFVNEPVQIVNELIKEYSLDRVQLSGDESTTYCRQIALPIIKVLHIAAGANSRDIVEKVGGWYTAMRGVDFHCLLDTAGDGVYGGTGQTFDRAIARDVAKHYPVLIAGGLTPENVGQVVREVRPWGVDVSSGVETDGRKDGAKIESFIRAVWNAE